MEKYFFGAKVSKYGVDNGKVDYRAMMEGFCSGAYILNNTLISCSDDFEIIAGTDYDEEEDTYAEIFQYYIIPDNSVQYFEEYTDEIIYYSERLDVYLLGVTHWGTSWDYVLTDISLKN